MRERKIINIYFNLVFFIIILLRILFHSLIYFITHTALADVHVTFPYFQHAFFPFLHLNFVTTLSPSEDLNSRKYIEIPDLQYSIPNLHHT